MCGNNIYLGCEAADYSGSIAQSTHELGRLYYRSAFDKFDFVTSQQKCWDMGPFRLPEWRTTEQLEDVISNNVCEFGMRN